MSLSVLMAIPDNVLKNEVESVFKSSGYNIIEISSGQELINALAVHEFGCLVITSEFIMSEFEKTGKLLIDNSSKFPVVILLSGEHLKWFHHFWNPKYHEYCTAICDPHSVLYRAEKVMNR